MVQKGLSRILRGTLSKKKKKDLKGNHLSLSRTKARGSSSSKVEGTQTRVDSDGVITWLQAGRDARPNELWEKFSFLPNFRVVFPSFGPQVVHSTEDQGWHNFAHWPKIHFTEGLRLPLPTLVHQFFHYVRVHSVHMHINVRWTFLGVSVMNRRHGARLGLEEILYFYTLKRDSNRKYYFVVDAQPL